MFPPQVPGQAMMAPLCGTTLGELKKMGRESLVLVCSFPRGGLNINQGHLSAGRGPICHSSSNHALPRQTYPFLAV